MSKYVTFKSTIPTTYALSKATPFTMPPATSTCYITHYSRLSSPMHISVLIHHIRTKGVMTVLPHLVGRSIKYRGSGYSIMSTIMASTSTGILYFSHPIYGCSHRIYALGSHRIIPASALTKLLTSGTYTLV